VVPKVEEDMVAEEEEEVVKGHPHLLEFFLKQLLDMLLWSSQSPLMIYSKTT
jgi:hypothetical protein